MHRRAVVLGARFHLLGGRHCWPSPCVPIPIVTTGRAPFRSTRPSARSTVPVTAMRFFLLGLGLVHDFPGFVARKRHVEVERRRAILDQFAVFRCGKRFRRRVRSLRLLALRPASPMPWTPSPRPPRTDSASSTRTKNHATGQFQSPTLISVNRVVHPFPSPRSARRPKDAAPRDSKARQKMRTEALSRSHRHWIKLAQWSRLSNLLARPRAPRASRSDTGRHPCDTSERRRPGSRPAAALSVSG